jgi:hypothetical protein
MDAHQEKKIEHQKGAQILESEKRGIREKCSVRKINK